MTLAAVALLFAATPGTALADSAAEQYTEPQIPTVPSDDNRSGEPGSNQAGTGSGGPGSVDGSTGAATGPSSDLDPPADSAPSPDSDPSADSTPSPDSDPSTDGGADEVGADKSAEDREAAAAALSGIGGGGGGSAGSGFELIIGLILLLPLILGGSYILWRQYGDGDDETRAQLQAILKDPKG